MIILTRGDIDVTTLGEGARAGWRGAKIDVHSFRFSDRIGSLRAVSARACSLLNSCLAFLADSERLDISSKLVASIIVLSWCLIALASRERF